MTTNWDRPFRATHRHFKGKLYEVLGEATHSESGEAVTIYRNEAGSIFTRPSDMFYEKLASLDGKARFEPTTVGNAGEQQAPSTNEAFEAWWESLPVNLPHDRRVFARLAFEAGQNGARQSSRLQSQLDRIERRLESLTLLNMASAQAIGFVGLQAANGPKTLHDYQNAKEMAEQLRTLAQGTDKVHGELLKKSVLGK